MPFEVTWLGKFKSELLGFPNVRFMDEIDAFTQMLEWVRNQDALPKPDPILGPDDRIADGSERNAPNLPEDYDPRSVV